MLKRSARTLAALMLALAAMLGLAAATAGSAMAAPSPYSVGTPVLIPDEGMYCYNWADEQLSTVADIEWHYVGLSGRADQNNMACRYMITSGLGENYEGGGMLRWIGWIGATPVFSAPIDYRDLCHMQYGPEVGVAWIDQSAKYVAANPAVRMITHSGWYCIGQPGKSYDQSSHQ